MKAPASGTQTGRLAGAEARIFSCPNGRRIPVRTDRGCRRQRQNRPPDAQAACFLSVPVKFPVSDIRSPFVYLSVFFCVFFCVFLYFSLFLFFSILSCFSLCFSVFSLPFSVFLFFFLYSSIFLCLFQAADSSFSTPVGDGTTEWVGRNRHPANPRPLRPFSAPARSLARGFP